MAMRESNLPVLLAWVHLTLRVGLGIVLFCLLIILADRHNRRFDLTPDQGFTLSGEAARVSTSLDQDVAVTFFFDGQQPSVRKQFEEMMALFAEVQPRITFRSVDLDRSPREAERYNIGTYNTGVVEIGGRSRILRGLDQESLVEAVLRLTQERTPTLCFITGHGEHSPEDADDRRGYNKVAKALEKENYAVRTLDYVPEPPDNSDPTADACTVVVLAGGQQALLPGEADRLVERLRRGGATLLMVEPYGPESTTRFLARVGVRLFNDVIVDEQNRFFGSDSFMPQVPVFDQQTFGSNLRSAAVFPIARTVHPGDESELPSSALLLALTADSSWARLGDEALPPGDIQFRADTDKHGPLPAAVIVREKRTPDGSAAGPRVGPMIVFGDSDFAANNYLDILGNRDLFMSSVAVLVENERLIAGRQQRTPDKFSPLYLTDEQMTVVRWVAMAATPSTFALLGVWITWRRRRRASRA